MTDRIGSQIYTKLEVRPVINAGGSTTRFGGSTPSPAVKRAMDEADGSWVEIQELLEKSGAYIADVLGVEAAYVTAGCYAALVLSSAACIAGKDPERAGRLPDTTGMANEILIQKSQRYGFDRCYTVPGGKLVEVGNEEGCSPEEMERAIGSDTAAVAYFIQSDWGSGVVSLEDTVRIARSKGVPVIADAASRIYPLDYFREVAQSADLVCFGGKYINAPQSTGFVCGRKDLVEAVAVHGFVSSRPFGRGQKLDRQEIAGVVAAFDEWFAMDHETRFSEYDEKIAILQKGLQGTLHLRGTEVIRTSRHPGVTLHVILDSEALGKSAQEVADELYAGNPRIRVLREGNDTLNINVHTLNDGEEQIVADRLRDLLEREG